MPVYYRETDVDHQPPSFEPRRILPQQMPQQHQQRLLLQPQFSAGSSLTGTTIVSPSESTYLFGTNDPRGGALSEGDGTDSFGTWLSASHLGATPQMAKAPPSQSPAPQQRMPVAVGKNQQHQPQSQLPHFPLEVRVSSTGGPAAGPGGNETRQSQEAPGEVSRRSERWSREEFYPPATNGGRVPGAPFHKVTKEDYVIEQVVESTPKLVNTTRIVYPAQQQQQPLGGQPQAKQMPRQQFEQPVQHYQQVQQMPKQPYQTQQQQQQTQRQPQQYQVKQEQPQLQQKGHQPERIEQLQEQRQPPQVPMKAQKVPEHVQQPQQQQQFELRPQQYEKPLQSQQQRQQHVQPVQQMQKSPNFAQQHQYVQQQVQFEQPRQQLHEQPQQALQREQQQQSMQQQQQQVQGVQIEQTHFVQMEQKQQQKERPQQQLQHQQNQQYLQYVQQQKERQPAGGRMINERNEQQQQQQEDQAVAGEQQQDKPNWQRKQQQKWNQQEQFEQGEQAVQQWRKQQQPKQTDKYATTWEQQQQHFVGEDEAEMVKQKHRTAQMAEAEEEGDDEPPPQMQLAEAPEELIQRQKSTEEHDESMSPERQTHRRHVMVNSPWYRQNPAFEHQKYQDFRNYAEPLYVCSDFPTDGSAYAFDDSMQKSPEKYHYQHFQPQQRVHQYFSPSTIKWDSVYEDEFPDGQPPPFAHGPGSPYDYLMYHQKVNLDRRRAESEQRRRNHSPVPGAAEHGYKFGGMDFVDHGGFNPYSDVGEPFDERQSRRDLHMGPPRRRGDFYGLDYTTMLPDGQLRQPNEWAGEDAQNYHGYQALPPRKNFRLCGRYTADPDAPLNIAEAEGLDELDSEYWVGNTLSNQHCVSDRELTDEEKRTFALLYGPGGFKPDHVTIRPDPVPDEPPVFSTTIGPQKSRSAADISPTPQDYVNPMKVEGESWMLGRRSEQSNYGLASSGEQPPFVRPARFPPHVPQWAKDRHFAMACGAKSVDRSLFAPSWAKVPQPQPPYWVKRTEGGKEVGAVQQAKMGNREEEEKEENEGNAEEQRVEAVQQAQQQSQQQRQPTQQQMGQRTMVHQQQQMQHQQVQRGQQQKTQQMQQNQRNGQAQQQQLTAQQQQQQQQVRAVQQQPQQQQQQVQAVQQQPQQQHQQVRAVQQQPQQQQQQVRAVQLQPQQQKQQVRAVQQQPQQQQQQVRAVQLQPQQQQQQVRAVQVQPQQFETGMQKTTIVTTVQINEEHQLDNQPQQKQQQQVGAVQRMDGQKKQIPLAQQQVKHQQQHQPQQQQQQIATAKTTTNSATTTKSVANGTPKVAQWQHQPQQQRQPEKQVQSVQQQFEQSNNGQEQPFNQPGGMFYFHEKQTDNSRGPKEQTREVQTERRVVTKQQQVQSADEASGLENLTVPKLGELPTFLSGGEGDKGRGKQNTGEQQQQQQMMRKGTTTGQMQPQQPKGQPNDAQAVQQQPMAQQNMAQQPMAQQPMAKQPMAQQRMAQQNMAQQPMEQQPMAKQYMAKQPMAQQNMAQQPMEQQPMAKQWMPKFPTGRRWSKEPQDGDIFVDGHGRPVHYVREVGTDPRTGEAVTREEWRVVDEQQWEEQEGEAEEEGQKGSALPANQSRQFRQQTTIQTSQSSFKQ